ncbi:hypothetical protein Nepgr_027855 [Nepenthes gracilis]|uniref:Uncharacterized protein n=1 Tax=Nepenthes gracilis TaxID=150966 RepID=A0AAD3TCH5_NEPGR|nr:hypothetical protein Nepgr_027855 [Nepenthes gracilis]
MRTSWTCALRADFSASFPTSGILDHSQCILIKTRVMDIWNGVPMFWLCQKFNLVKNELKAINCEIGDVSAAVPIARVAVNLAEVPR